MRHRRIQLEDVLTYLNRTITDLAAFSGMEMENMTRGHGWRFLDLGRRLERSINLVGLLRSALGGIAETDDAILKPLLEVADSAMTYRRRYFARPQAVPVLDLLLADDTNTRALVFQLASLTRHIGRLPRDPGAPSPTREERLVESMNAEVQDRVIPALRKNTEESLRELVEFLDAAGEDLRTLSDAITYFYFSHAELRVS